MKKTIREPIDVDLIIHSKPWTEEELQEFRKIMNRQKQKNKRRRKAKQTAEKE